MLGDCCLSRQEHKAVLGHLVVSLIHYCAVCCDKPYEPELSQARYPVNPARLRGQQQNNHQLPLGLFGLSVSQCMAMAALPSIDNCEIDDELAWELVEIPYASVHCRCADEA